MAALQVLLSEPVSQHGFTALNVAFDTTLAFQLPVTDSHGVNDSGRVTILVKHMHRKYDRGSHGSQN
ncbi:MAG: hypothetical protein FIO02_05730 [Nitrosopumilales archaeon]|nr:hypothetical protein [Nitrosopumilales archaeon]